MDEPNTANRLGVVGLLVDEGQRASATRIERILTRHANIVKARSAVRCVRQGARLHTLVVDATSDEMGALTGQLGMVPGARVKSFLL